MNHIHDTTPTGQTDLGDGYALAQAGTHEFVTHANIYRDGPYNVNTVHTWDLRVSMYTGWYAEHCYWLLREGQRIGGVAMAANELFSFFLIPPCVDILPALKKVKQTLVQWSDPHKRIQAYEVIPDQVDHFLRAGFLPGETYRWMLRPTEHFDVQWAPNLRVDAPRAGIERDVSRLFYETLLVTPIDQHAQRVAGGAQIDPAHWDFDVPSILDYLNYAPNQRTFSASSLIYDQTTHQLIGACLINESVGWPNVWNIVVHPAYQGRGLATNMLKRALATLHPQYPILRLLVTQGNAAESVYYHLGFQPGLVRSTLYLPAESTHLRE
jgi:ribosomal protein S18 acetylase RimI-like enzyme